MPTPAPALADEYSHAADAAETAGAPTAQVEPAAAAGGSYGAHGKTHRVGPGQLTAYGTGSRINAPLEELPASITLVDHQALRERGATDLEQALNLVPGVQPIWTYGGFLDLTLRGFKAITLVDGHRDTRTMVAGSAPQGALFDLDRLEVLRGPSSVLYGYGAVGGVINLIRRQPSRTPEAVLDLGLGLPNQQVIHAGAQGPLGQYFAYRVDLGRVNRTDFRGASTQRNQATASVLFAPVHDHTFSVRLSYNFDHYSTDVGIPTVEDPDNPGQWVLPRGARSAARYNTKNDYLDYQRLELGAEYRWDISHVTYLQARGNILHDYYDYLAAESLTYVPGTTLDMVTAPATVEREYLHFARGWTPVVGQLELHTEAMTGPIKHQVVAGYELNAFYGKSDRGDNGAAEPGPVDFTWPQDAAVATHTLQRTAQDHYRHITHSVYAFDHIHLLSNLILTGGLRYDAVRSRVRRIFFDRETGEGIPDPMSGQVRRPVRASPSALTGSVGLVYDPIEPLSAYVGYANAFKPIFVSAGALDGTTWSPERSQQLEGGIRVRGRVGGHVLDLDAAGYYIEKRHMLISRGSDAFEQAGKATSRGLDVSVHYQAPQVLGVDVSYALTHARFEEYNADDPVSGETVSLEGKRPGFVPRHMGQLWLRFSITDHIGFGVGGRLVADQFADQANRVKLPSYGLLDMSVWIRSERVSFNLSGRNVLDEHDYFTSAINSSSLNPQVTPGPGREILGTLRLTL
ncbi:MAG: TonB-dependent receptor [Polyangiales bacterium]